MCIPSWCPWPRRSEADVLRAELKTARQILAEWRKLDGVGHTFALKYECKICLSRPIECVHLPCGHCMACSECSARLVRCPLCNEDIAARTCIFMG